MKLSLTPPTPLAYFASLVQSDDEFALLEAAICLGQDDDPDFDVQQVLSEVDQLQARLKRRMAADASPLQKLRILNQFFYQDLGFAGNLNHYYDPENSFIHVVLRSRLAIPISMAVLWLELAQSLGLAARGVSFPGHFMVKVNLPHGQVVMDPLTGQSLSREALSERLQPFRRQQGLDDEFEAPLGLFLQASPPRDIVARMLRNLQEIYTSQEDWARLIAVHNRLIVLLPQDWPVYRDRGLAHAELSHTAQAVDDLQTYLDHVANGVDRSAIAQRMLELQSKSR
jgi:regulator of sirC expression with transglutaminase-like and TPR domain